MQKSVSFPIKSQNDSPNHKKNPQEMLLKLLSKHTISSHICLPIIGTLCSFVHPLGSDSGRDVGSLYHQPWVFRLQGVVGNLKIHHTNTIEAHYVQCCCSSYCSECDCVHGLLSQCILDINVISNVNWLTSRLALNVCRHQFLLQNWKGNLTHWRTMYLAP